MKLVEWINTLDKIYALTDMPPFTEMDRPFEVNYSLKNNYLGKKPRDEVDSRHKAFQHFPLFNPRTRLMLSRPGR